jgi:hypothetical protein
MQTDRFFLTRLAAAVVADTARSGAGSGPVKDLAQAREVLAAVEQRIGQGELRLKRFVPAIEIEIAIAAAEEEEAASIPPGGCDPLFRLHMARWAMAADDLRELVPLRDPRLRVLEFDYDVSEFMEVRAVADLPASPTPRRSYMVAFGCADGERRNPLVVDGATAQILKLSDGTRTALEVIRDLEHRAGGSAESGSLEWIENLFVHGLISLHDERLDRVSQARPDGVVPGSHASV